MDDYDDCERNPIRCMLLFVVIQRIKEIIVIRGIHACTLLLLEDKYYLPMFSRSLLTKKTLAEKSN